LSSSSALWSCAPWAQHVARRYLWYIELRELAFKFPDFVVFVVSRDPYCPDVRGATESVQVKRTGRWGCMRRGSGKGSDVSVSVEGDVRKCGCCAIEIDIGVVEKVGHGWWFVCTAGVRGDAWEKLFSAIPEHETETRFQEREATGPQMTRLCPRVG
jgi:hypothetical protein